MDTRINLELGKQKKSEVVILDLSNCKTGGEIDGLTEEFSALENLDMQNAALVNIKMFPKLVSLKKLDLSGNRISKGLDVLKDCKNLRTLSIDNNKFKDVETLEPLKDLEFLTNLDIDGNEFEETKADFRAKVFKMLPSLMFLDGEDKDGNEAKSDDEEDDEEDDDDDSEDDEEESETDDDDDGPGLSALYDNTALLDEDDEADFDAEAVGDVSSDELGEDEEDDDEPQTSKGQKRKLEDGDSD